MKKGLFAALSLGLFLVSVGTTRADDQAEMKALLDKATKALGGRAKLTKFKAFTAKGKGKIHVGGTVSFAEESYWQAPGQYRFDLDLDLNGNLLSEKIILNGGKGWVKLQDQVAKLPKNVHTAFKEVNHAIGLAMRPLDAQGKGYQLSPLGELKIANRPAVGVKITRKGNPDVDLFLDKESFLPVQCEIRSKDDQSNKEVAHTLLFSDYKKFGELKSFGKLVWKKDGTTYVERNTIEIKAEEKLDADLFARPQ
jgi:hypothetical protein